MLVRGCAAVFGHRVPGCTWKGSNNKWRGLFKLLVGEFAGLFEAVDSLTNVHVDVTAGSNFVL